jgi:hypothetical protein
MPSGGRRRRRRRANGERIGWLPITLASLSVLVLASILGASVWKRYSAVPHDKLSGCPATGPVAVHAILIDRSDPLTEVQAQRLTQLVETTAQNALVDERIDLYVLTSGKGTVATPEVSLCRPRSEGDPFTENPERLRRIFVNRFVEPVQAALKRLETPQEAPNSPIMESIKAVCIGAFGGLPRSARARLTIASDMIENSSVLNQYKPYDIEAFMRNPNLLLVLADCHGADVDILYFTRSRDARLQTRMHQLFWERFLARMNASLVSMERI